MIQPRCLRYYLKIRHNQLDHYYYRREITIKINMKHLLDFYFPNCKVLGNTNLDNIPVETEAQVNIELVNKIITEDRILWVISLSRKRSPILADYYMNGQLINRVHSTKDIGVTYDDSFSFKNHHELTLVKAKSLLSFVKRQCYGRFNVAAVRMLYSAVVRSHLEFASTIWAHPVTRECPKAIRSVRQS